MKEEELKYLILNIVNNIENLDEKVRIIKEKYYNKKNNFEPYVNTKNKLVQLVIEDEFPSPQKWNEIAQKEGYFSSISIKYLEQCDWRKLETKIRQELKEILK